MNQIITLLKLNDWSPPPEQVSFNTMAAGIQDIKGQGSLIGPLTALERRGAVPSDVQAWIADQTFYVKAGDRQISVPVKPFLERVKKATAEQPGQQQPMAYDLDGGGKLIVTEAYGMLNEPPTMYRVVFWIILPQ